MTDKKLAQKELDKLQGEFHKPKIKKGGIVVGTPSKGYEELMPEKVGEVLMGTSEKGSGMTWSSEITAKRMRFKLGKTKHLISMEAILLEGSLTGASNTIPHKIPHILNNILSFSVLITNDAGLEWQVYEGTYTYFDKTNMYLNTIPSGHRAGLYRVLVFMKEGVLDINDAENPEE